MKTGEMVAPDILPVEAVLPDGRLLEALRRASE